MSRFALPKPNLMETEIFDAIIISETATENVQPNADKNSDKDFDSYGFYPDASF